MWFGASKNEDHKDCGSQANDDVASDFRHSCQRGGTREVTFLSGKRAGTDSSMASRYSSQRGDAALSGVPHGPDHMCTTYGSSNSAHSGTWQRTQDCGGRTSDDFTSGFRHSSQRGDTQDVIFPTGNPAGMGTHTSDDSSSASGHSSQQGDTTLSGVPVGADHVRAMYRTSNSAYSGTWQRAQGALGSRAVPIVDPHAEHHPNHPDTFYRTTNQAYCGNGPRVSRAVRNRPFVNNAKTMLSGLGSVPTHGNGFKVISAGVPSKPFPAEASAFVTPKSSRRGADNLFYQTSSQAIGSIQVEDEHIPDRYFPSNNNFTTSFVDKKPRYTGFNTNPSRSKVHRSLDECY